MIIVYSTDTCPFCIILKEKLAKNEVPFEVFDDEDYMMNIMKLDEIPVMKLEDGTMLSYEEAIKWIKKYVDSMETIG